MVPSLSQHFEDLFNKKQNNTIENSMSQIDNLNDPAQEFQLIVLSDHITTINEAIYDFMLENLEKIDEDEEFGMNY